MIKKIHINTQSCKDYIPLYYIFHNKNYYVRLIILNCNIEMYLSKHTLFRYFIIM